MLKDVFFFYSSTRRFVFDVMLYIMYIPLLFTAVAFTIFCLLIYTLAYLSDL